MCSKHFSYVNDFVLFVYNQVPSEASDSELPEEMSDADFEEGNNFLQKNVFYIKNNQNTNNCVVIHLISITFIMMFINFVIQVMNKNNMKKKESMVNGRNNLLRRKFQTQWTIWRELFEFNSTIRHINVNIFCCLIVLVGLLNQLFELECCFFHLVVTSSSAPFHHII